MQITRIDWVKSLDAEAKSLQVKIGARHFTLKEESGGLYIHAHREAITVKHCYPNEILILSHDG